MKMSRKGSTLNITSSKIARLKKLCRETKQINTVKPVSQPFEILAATSERLFETNAQDIFT